MILEFLEEKDGRIILSTDRVSLHIIAAGLVAYVAYATIQEKISHDDEVSGNKLMEEVDNILNKFQEEGLLDL